MKRCIRMIVAITAFSIVLNLSSSDVKIIPTTVGNNSIVHAIRQHSHITQAYVNRWKPFGLWIIGSTLRSGVVNTIKKYIKVCKSLTLAHYSFPDEESLIKSFPINWTAGALCAALKDLKNQGMYALALVAQVGAESDDVQGLDVIITSYITIIEHNQNVLKATCTALAEKKMEQQEKIMKEVLAQETVGEKQWKNVTAQVKIVQDIEKVVGLVRGGMETAVPTALLGMVIYLAQKVGIFDSSNRGME